LDICVTEHAIYINPALSVRLSRYSSEGKTPEIKPKAVRMLLHSLDTSTVTGKRDKAIIAVMVYTICRIGVISKLRIKDFVYDGDQYVLQVMEKGGKSRPIPVRYDLQGYIIDYMTAAGIMAARPETPPLPPILKVGRRSNGSKVCKQVSR